MAPRLGRGLLAGVFAGLALVLLAVAAPTNLGADGASMYAVTDGLLRGTLHVPCPSGVPGPGGCVSEFYPLLSFVMVPFALLGRGLARIAGLPGYVLGESTSLAVSALSTAAAGALCSGLALGLGAERRRAVLAGVTCALGTEMLTYSRTLFAESLAAALLAAAAWGVLQARPGARRAGLLACALGVLAKPQLGLAVVGIAIALAVSDRRLRPALEVLGALAAGVGLYLAYNLWRVGDPLDFSRRAGELASGTPHHGTAALAYLKEAGVLLVSPNHGVLWYSPVVLLGAVGLWRARPRRTAAVCLAAAAGLLLVYLPAPYGNAWGTRYLVPATPLLAAGLAVLPRRLWRLALVLGAITLVAQLPNLAGNYDRYLYARPTPTWTLTRVQLIGVWPSAVAQVGDALGNPPQHLVEEVVQGPGHRGRALRSVALWWWLLPAAGVPALAGALVALAMIGLGARTLRRTAAQGAGGEHAA